MRRALISVSDKSGIVELGTALAEAGIEIVSTGGTATTLRDAGVDVVDVHSVTGFPEILDGRVKTLHPAIHAGLLARRDDESHRSQLADLGIEAFDIVVVNLYPFGATIGAPGTRMEDAIEQIDIGGPTMIRAAAKNHRDVLVIVDASDYPGIIRAVQTGDAVSDLQRLELASKAFRHTAAYDAIIAQYLTDHTGEEFPEQLTITLEKVQDLRYGENPHQGAAFYASPRVGTGVAQATQRHGKELSYNNIGDASAALELAHEFTEPVAVIVKHTNPCGVAVAPTIHKAWERALAGDPVSAFGGIVAVNRPVDRALALALVEVFLEVVIAPRFDDDAVAVLSTKPNLRLLEVGAMTLDESQSGGVMRRANAVAGGVLLQDPDTRTLDAAELRVVTQQSPTQQQFDDLQFGWRVVKHVKSNAVVLAAGGQLFGVGAGQMNRVGAARIALDQAGAHAAQCVLASDAFFPMPDSIEVAAQHGVRAIIQPGGSRRDDDCIAAADAAGIAMVFTGVRHFRH